MASCSFFASEKLETFWLPHPLSVRPVHKAVVQVGVHVPAAHPELWDLEAGTADPGKPLYGVSSLDFT